VNHHNQMMRTSQAVREPECALTGTPRSRGSDAAESSANPVEEAAAVSVKQAEESGVPGRAGRPIDRRSPFFIGMAGAAGVAITTALAELVIHARSVLVLIGLAPIIRICTLHALSRYSPAIAHSGGYLESIWKKPRSRASFAALTCRRRSAMCGR
jgi:hypothetical protein